MKKILLALFLTFGVVISASAQSWNWDEPALTGQHQQHDATLTIVNRSEYTLTVKVLRTNQRGLYQTLYISPRSSSVVHFSRSDSFYTYASQEYRNPVISPLQHTYQAADSLVSCNP